ncbi:MAG: hypothetical protein ACO3NY_07650, partial [Poseidonia sp.]
MNRRLSLTIVLVLGLALLTFLNLVGDWGRLSGGMANLSIFFRESLWPPDWSVLEAQSYPVCEARLEFTCSVAWLGMVETIKIAFVATVIGFVVALPLSVMAASNLSPIEIAVPTRILLAGMRSLPSIIWAVLFMIIFDMGTLAGICAMSFYTVGYLGKLQFESMEGIKNAPLEAAKAMGMTRTHFKNMSGLTESGHLSTARDMTILGRQLFYDFPQYYNLFSRRQTDAGVRTVYNTNRKLLSAYKGADGIKTGYTSAAGFNLVASAERNGERIIATVFGGRSSNARNAKVAELLDLGFKRAPRQVTERPPRKPNYQDPGARSLPMLSVVRKSLRPKARPGSLNTPADAPMLVAEMKDDIKEVLREAVAAPAHPYPPHLVPFPP